MTFPSEGRKEEKSDITVNYFVDRPCRMSYSIHMDATETGKQDEGTKMMQLTSNPAAPIIALLAETPAPMPMSTLLKAARRSKGWHQDLDNVRDFVGDYLRDAGAEYPTMDSAPETTPEPEPTPEPKI